jgi:N utilization substance protein B
VGERREARELAVQCLHEWDQQRPQDDPKLTERFIEEGSSSPAVGDYARQVVGAFIENAASIDECIQRAAENWKLARMAVVDRNILRLAVTEFRHLPEVPAKVVIDEAIELAKKYSTEKSSAFVNGILDRILTEQEKTDGPR